MKRSILILLIPVLSILFLSFGAVPRLSTSMSLANARYTYQGGSNSFVSQLDQGKVETAVINTKDQTVQVTTTNGQKYSVNYPDTTQLTELLA
ncbi:MAG TPA: ATP-dependent metallopeptidase FtsH/Yme1/Tma family protein, partial [Thermoleophilia bacterium]|nr:ATP-dependent metallopeptidase FtsH/Yme1/Tma family protein [Thermoleophilia bacterium]